MQDMRREQLLPFAAVGCALTVLGVFPLYIDRYINLGATKFTGFLTLSLIWLGAFALCLLLAPARQRRECLLRCRRPGTAWLLALMATNLAATLYSLDPESSSVGRGSYYGGLSLVLLGGLLYLGVRGSWPRQGRDLELVWAAAALAACLAVLLALCNTFNIDPLGCYEGIAERYKEQFLGVMGQQDFNGSYLALALPLALYPYLTAKTKPRLWGYGLASLCGLLALCTINTDSILLGLLAFGLALICLPGFDTQQLERLFWLGGGFFALDLAEYLAKRAAPVVNGGNSFCAQLGAPAIALPCGALCLGLALWLYRQKGAPKSLCRVGRWVALGAVAAVAAALALFNLTGFQPDLGEHLNNLFYFSDEWGSRRGVVWRSAWQMFCEAPLARKLLGYGPGMLHNAFALWTGGDYSGLGGFYAAHNEYLELLVSTGLLGLAAWVGFVGWHVVRGWRQSADPAAAGLTLALISYLTQAVVSIRGSMVFPEVMLCLALLAAVTDAAPAGQEPAPRRRAPQPLPCRRWVLLCLCAVLPALLWGSLARCLFGEFLA